MSRALNFPAEFRDTGRYCPECRAGVDHDKHRIVTVPEGGLPPVGQYSPEHEPQLHQP